jgi:hypothetical protein
MKHFMITAENISPIHYADASRADLCFRRRYEIDAERAAPPQLMRDLFMSRFLYLLFDDTLLFTPQRCQPCLRCAEE